MKRLRLWSLLLALMQVALTRTAVAQAGKVTIDRIEADVQISGSVSGVTPAAEYKVLVYVHTDRWYIHPWAERGEGQSWASINEDGNWHVATVQRQYKADKVAALVVARSATEPATLNSFDRLPHVAMTIKTLTGTPDYGKL